MIPEPGPRLTRVPLAEAPAALTVDVEEWYHTCLVPEYVDPTRRPTLPEELGWLLPEILDLFDQWAVRGTFFVLGEVAERWGELVTEIDRRGHEVACHGFFHLRSASHGDAAFRDDLRRCRELLERLVGHPVVGYRAPEWSLRRVDNPRLRTVAELGFGYDSSLVPWIGAGSTSNPLSLTRLLWRDRMLLEAPPLCLGGPLRLPASGWPASLGLLAHAPAAALRHRALGGVPVLVVHPWEISERPTPGELTGFGRFVHEAGRAGFRERLGSIVADLQWAPLRDSLHEELTACVEELEARAVPSTAALGPVGGPSWPTQLTADATRALSAAR